MAFALVARPDGSNWVGETPGWFGDSIFGGLIAGQAAYVAAATAPADRRVHSVHAYFIRPVVAGPPLVHSMVSLKEGRSFATRRVDAYQHEKLVFSMTYSLAADSDGYEYEARATESIPAPEQLAVKDGPAPWLIADVGPTPPDRDGTRRSTHRAWLRWPHPVDDPALQLALVTMFSDVTGVGGRPLYLEEDYRGIISIDHAVWFHRPMRADEWFFYDVTSVINTAGRGLLRGSMRARDGRLATSVAQEQLLVPIGDDPRGVTPG